MSTQIEENPNDKFGLDRIVFFSDAVIAIAITLLVVEITPPEIAAEFVDAQLTSQVFAMWPKFVGFLVSFWVIALHWLAHHRMFCFIRKYDHRMMYINLIFLMCIAFMPFATALLFEYPARQLTVTIYAGLVVAAGLSLFWLWRYSANGRRLVGEHASDHTIQAVGRHLIITPATFLLSIVIALFDPQLAMYSWILILPIYRVFRF